MTTALSRLRRNRGWRLLVVREGTSEELVRSGAGSLVSGYDGAFLEGREAETLEKRFGFGLVLRAEGLEAECFEGRIFA